MKCGKQYFAPFSVFYIVSRKTVKGVYTVFRFLLYGVKYKKRLIPDVHIYIYTVDSFFVFSSAILNTQTISHTVFLYLFSTEYSLTDGPDHHTAV